MVKASRGEQVFYVLNYSFLTLVMLTCLYPFIYIIATSFSSTRAVNSGEVLLWPVEPNLEAYRQLLLDGQIFNSMKNTVLLTLVGTVINMFCTILCAYSLSKKRLHGRNFFMGIIVFTMMFSGGMIPGFLLIRSLRLMDSYWALWLGSMLSTYNMIVLRTFFAGIPESLEEAAQIDGASDPYILFRIVLPLSGAALATITLFYAVGWWNSYFSSMLYISSTNKWPLMVKLRAMLDTAQFIKAQADTGVVDVTNRPTVALETFKAASILVSVLPIMCVYPFLQKYFVKGVMIGSIKG
ncbi:MAG: carbohydrate ABC transporter permease [Spirochaetaceae bacterium]|jgi:putative aldouronate transport system permease protein|nr:carbohydrate ABC transporter permease [Spirochaetaceae bacterium]